MADECQTGFFRLWIVISTIWVVGWIAYIWGTRLDAVEDATKLPFLAFHTDFGPGWRELKDFGPADYLAIFERAVAGPAAFLMLGLAIAWIGSGFKRKAN